MNTLAPKTVRLRQAALFLLSAASIAFQLNVMRVFSVGNWSNFGSMVISIAMLGIGLSGTLIAFIQKRVRENPGRWLRVTSVIIVPATAFCYILAQKVPFNPVWISTQKIQWLWIALFYLLYAIPFFCNSMFIGVIFTVMGAESRKLYFWNMAGSGVGGFIILGLMFLMPAQYLIVPIVILMAVGAMLTLFKEKENRQVLLKRSAAVLAGFTLLGVVFLLLFGQITVSDYKGIAQAKVTFADLEEKSYSYSPLGEMTVFQSEQYHFAPGLSDNAVFYLAEMPKKAFWALYINGDGPIGIMRKLKDDEKKYMDFLPMSAPYQIKKNPNVMLVKLGGGSGTFTALHNDAEKVTVVEPNPQMVKLMRDNPEVSEFNGHLLENPRVKVVVDEPRAYARKRKNRGQFDIVEISLIDSVGLSNSVGNALGENYTYTTDAIKNYYEALNEGGILSITTWNNLSPPRNVPRLITTTITALKEIGIENPEDYIYSFNLLYSTATIMIKKGAYTPEEIDELDYFAYRMSFETLWKPGMESPENVDFEKMLESYHLKFDAPEKEGASPMDMDLYPRRPADMYHFTFKWLFEGKEKELYEKYIFDIRPTTDNRPFFTAFLNRTSLKVFMDELKVISEEWGYLLILVTLVQALLFGLLIIVIPIIGGRKTSIRGQKGILGVIVYYSCLGLGFMFVEIFLIQKLVFFLGDPVFSTSIVITAMLILSGLGSLYSNRFKGSLKKNILIAAVIVATTLILYFTVLPGFLQALLGWPLIIKMLIAILVMVPSAFCMGMFFPSGLSSLSEKKPSMVPWAWGVNGALSVTGSMLPKLMSIHWGFSTVLIAAAALYLIAGLVYKSNES